MFYQAELDFFIASLRKFHLQAELLTAAAQPEQPLDFGLRAFLGQDSEYQAAFQTFFRELQPNTIHHMTDAYGCGYIFLLLPESVPSTLLMIGPFLSAEIDRQQMLETAERLGVPPRDFQQLEKYYLSMPLLSDENPIYAMLNAFAERIWGRGDAYEIVDVRQELSSAFTPIALPASDSPESLLMNMQLMEQRYAYENELIRSVSQGLVHRADKMLSGFSQVSFEQRLGDPIRNLKNYAIICNTILRKAAEQGGVHPVYLDSVSGEFARRIEAIRSFRKGQDLMGEMIRSYCRLVKKHATGQYSATVQRTIAYIDAEISGDLQLQTLARLQNINASYLSTLFRKETGHTITDHINAKRMEHAAHLLQSTRLQVQSIAQHCGISDANYFSKLFKKHTGVTPGEYRRRLEHSI